MFDHPAPTGRYNWDVGATSLLVRPALQLAWAVAREGDRGEVPGPMRPFVRLSRLPDRALDTVRSVVDEDTAFRERVAAAADEAVLGRVPWLWLVRPPGWTDEVTAAAAASEARAQVEDDRRAERVAQRRLGQVEATLQRTDAELIEARAAWAAASAEVVELRQERRGALEEARSLGEALLATTEACADAERRALAAERRQAEVEQLLVQAEGRLATSEAARAEMEARLEADRRARHAEDRVQRAEDERTEASRSALGQAVAEAAAAARDLGGALDRASLILGAAPDATAPAAAGGTRPTPPPVSTPGTSRAVAGAAAGGKGSGARRREVVPSAGRRRSRRRCSTTRRTRPRGSCGSPGRSCSSTATTSPSTPGPGVISPTSATAS